jgi:hypothetical protein
MTLTPRTEARAEDAIEKGEAVALLPSRVAYPTSPPRSVPLKKGKPGQMSQVSLNAWVRQKKGRPLSFSPVVI